MLRAAWSCIGTRYGTTFWSLVIYHIGELQEYSSNIDTSLAGKLQVICYIFRRFWRNNTLRNFQFLFLFWAEVFLCFCINIYNIWKMRVLVYNPDKEVTGMILFWNMSNVVAHPFELFLREMVGY
jgi:hypothetical protein